MNKVEVLTRQIEVLEEKIDNSYYTKEVDKLKVEISKLNKKLKKVLRNENVDH